ncbi:Glutathione S-transferase 1, isoform D [Armadillidium nasatum]|uniref:Glutathione S-transferase 1, isoform D n=1 Tax=Armadillidium nasatum TaxID=96803 RepID=A0A5N5SUI8_9CRUS|nr:Glutathione S-transferase 1, isoform D [Armadillidium nasatum]
MDFYYMDISAPCRSIMLVAKAVGVTLNKKVLDVLKKEQMSQEFIAINPQHCIPTLVDGDLKLWESRAICCYLATRYGKDDTLYPNDPKIRVLIDRLLYFDMGTLYKRFGEYVYPVIFNDVKPDSEKLQSLHEALGWLEGFINGHDFAVGNNLTIADYVLIASVDTFIETGIDISKYPNIKNWVQRCKTQMKDYESENGKGAKEFGAWVKPKLS